jgi:hypothetical protein
MRALIYVGLSPFLINCQRRKGIQTLGRSEPAGNRIQRRESLELGRTNILPSVMSSAASFPAMGGELDTVAAETGADEESWGVGKLFYDRPRIRGNLVQGRPAAPHRRSG